MNRVPRRARLGVLTIFLAAAGAVAFATRNAGHYPARETDAAFVRVDSLSRTNPAPEHDKFLFYRGVGNFTTPLFVAADGNGTLTLTNTGAGPLSHLFVLRVRDGKGSFVALDSLSANSQRSVAFDPNQPFRELVRVMVGRAEVITPALQQELANSITAAKNGDAGAKEEAEATLRRFGRFAEPALQLATDSAPPDLRQSGWKLLQAMNEGAAAKRL